MAVMQLAYAHAARVAATAAAKMHEETPHETATNGTSNRCGTRLRHDPAPRPFWARHYVRYATGILCIVLLIEQLDLIIQMPKLDNLVGFAHPQFAKVEKVFRKNFHDGWEREGAAIAVYHKGELVVDLQGGYADASALRKWTPQTRTVVFSATKAVGALCIALLVDRGHLRYSDLVSQYWPEFAQNGKENITVDWIMSHRAGLAALDEPISREDAFNPERIGEIIARQKPNWIPGTKSGYHALTYGWLVDQLIRRADPKKRGIGQFFREEIAQPHGIDFHIGLPPEEEHTVSRISLPSNLHVMKEIIYDPRILIMLAILYLRPPNSIAWKDMNTFNDPELHRMEQAAALGITKARDLGKIFALFQQGKIVSKELVSLFKEPQISNGLDEVILAPMAKGHGFLYEKHPYKRGHWLVGHPGYGGSSVMMEMENEIVIAYVSNGLKTGMGELTRTYRLLRNAVLSSL
ncbi:Beta-lactamase domain-containing protein 2 [Toxocara canis]|uniref:Beta-lactamase domain-containing protein 2 n=1 Tax=Toxocara canis TaxID=6265 RepID=A0A0B2VYL3_TOXCA|nr:Beta-lactamase domain-containing protein 2 [Toxocara canis]